MAFDRRSGLNVLARNEQTAHLRRQAPRSLQIGLLTPCNLSCDFCYRDVSAPSRLNAPFLVDLLQKASAWGVLEVSFGGGEPLLFPGFVDLIRRLHETTELGVNFTTNGTLLTDATIAALAGAVGEIRLSAYPGNDYRRTLRMLAGTNVGINWLVTPENVGQVEVVVRDCLALGARNVLLLGYKGSDAALHLSEEQLQRLRRAVMRLEGLPLRLDVCWYPSLSDLSHLFARPDCGAGDEFLVVTPDRAVQPCSFHHRRIPFDTFEDLRRIYHELRAERPPAEIDGCTRRQFAGETPSLVPLTSSTAVTPATWVWRARAGNNSGDWTIVGRFAQARQAEQAAEALRELARAHEAFLASPEGQLWLEQRDYNGSHPTPPLAKFGEAHGFDWSQKGHGLWWEEDGCGAPVLTAGAVGDAVIVYHPYCMGLPEEPFRRFFAKVGGVEIGHWQYDRPRVVARAIGSDEGAAEAVRRYAALVKEADYPSDVVEPPPWGATCDDPRVRDDEDRSARLSDGDVVFQIEGDRLHAELRFENLFAGAVALENWLREHGFSDVTLEVEFALVPIEGRTDRPSDARTGLFGDLRPLGDRLAELSSAELVDMLFSYRTSVPQPLAEAVARLPAEERVALARETWERRRGGDVDVHWQALRIIKEAGTSAADWMRALWDALRSENYAGTGAALKALHAALPHDEAFARARSWLEEAVDRGQQTERLEAFGALHHPATAEFIEAWWTAADAGAPITAEWGGLAADSQVDWPQLRVWIERGRPLAFLALDALDHYAEKGLPREYHRPTAREFHETVTAYGTKDLSPRGKRIVERVLGEAVKLAQPPVA